MRRGRNRRIEEKSTFTRFMGRTAVFIALVLAGTLVYFYQDMRCVQLNQDLAAARRKAKRLDDELIRERARFNEMITREGLQERLNRCGLKMGYPQAIQLVKMDKRGMPKPGQKSLLVAARYADEARASVEETAKMPAPRAAKRPRAVRR